MWQNAKVIFSVIIGVVGIWQGAGGETGSSARRVGRVG